MLSFKVKPRDRDVLAKFPVYAAVIENIVLDPINRNGFSFTTSNSTHRSVWYSVLNHYGIKYSKCVEYSDWVNGYTVDKDGNRHNVPVCYASKDDGRVYHWKDFCCSTCENVPSRVIDVSEVQVIVSPYNLEKRMHSKNGPIDRTPHRLFCVEGEDLNPIVPVTEDTQIVDGRAVRKMHPPTIVH